MTDSIAEQIKRRFGAIQDVKFASSQTSASLVSRSYEPDIVVETWMNSRLYVYILERAPKTRSIRAILKQNTSASIGSLFLVDAVLLPGDDYYGKLQDWQHDLRVMNLGAIYAFKRGDDAVHLIQVNFDETLEHNHFRVWYSDDFPFDAVSVRRREYQSQIRGNWYIGDIASPNSSAASAKNGRGNAFIIAAGSGSSWIWSQLNRSVRLTWRWRLRLARGRKRSKKRFASWRGNTTRMSARMKRRKRRSASKKSNRLMTASSRTGDGVEFFHS